ncbi:MAG: hypothetical protein U0939_22795 [Pirellulales bacterium]
MNLELVVEVKDVFVVAAELLGDGVVQVADQPVEIHARQLDGRDVDVEEPLS